MKKKIELYKVNELKRANKLCYKKMLKKHKNYIKLNS